MAFEQLRVRNQERKKIVADKLKSIREERDLKTRDIIAALKNDGITIDRDTYRTYEIARSQPSFELMLSLARFYNLPVTSLYGEADRERRLLHG